MNPAVQNQIYEEIQQKEKFSYEDIRDFKVDFSVLFIRRDKSQIRIGNLVCIIFDEKYDGSNFF